MSDTATRAPDETVSVHTRLPAPIVDEIDRRAAADRRTRSFIVRDVVEAYFAEHGTELRSAS